MRLFLICSATVLWAGAASLLGGCSTKRGPSDEAVQAYVEGQTPSEAAPTGPAKARRVAITVERAEGLPDLDPGPGVSDPYTILEYDGTRQRTSTIDGDLNPVWGDTFIFDIAPQGVLSIRVMDEDGWGSDDLIGTHELILPEIRVDETRRLTIPIRQGQAGTLWLLITGLEGP